MALRLIQSLEQNGISHQELFAWTEDQWYQFLEPAGKAKDKAPVCYRLMQKIREDFRSPENLNLLGRFSDEQLINYLTTLPGIKLKSALCVMLYSLNRAVFPADSHCLRILNRIGCIHLDIRSKQQREQAQAELNQAIRGDYQLCYELHTLFIVHGKKTCGRIPRCELCCLKPLCAYSAAST